MVDPVIPAVATGAKIVPYIARKLNILKSITISIENNSSHSLTRVTMYYNGDNSNPPNSIIKPRTSSNARFGDRVKGAKGMLCYRVEESYGPSECPLYLLIGWKLTLARSTNQFCIVLHEYREQPLRGNRKENKKFCKSVLNENSRFSYQSIRWENDDFIICATMSSVNSAVMKVQFYQKRIKFMISIENNSLHSLTDVTMYYYRDNSEPPDSTIGPRSLSIARFEGNCGTTGMLCYRVKKSYGPSGDPYYLLMGWNLTLARTNQFCIVLRESREQPLRGNREENGKFCELVLNENKRFLGQNIRLESDDFIIGATMSSVSSAVMKVQFYQKRIKFTISIENNGSRSLTDVTMYRNGDTSNPPNSIIKPRTSSYARFEGNGRTTGMLCYRVKRSYWLSGGSLYLLIGWNLTLDRRTNQFCIVLYESKEQPLRGNQEENKKFCKSVLNENSGFPDQSIHLESDDFKVSATISSVIHAEMKVQLSKKRIKLHRKFFIFLKRTFRKNQKKK